MNSTPSTHEASTVKLAELIKEIRVAMLTTFPLGPGGAGAHARPMYTMKLDPEHFNGELWFMTDTTSLKTREISSNERVLVLYAAPDKNRYVTVYGRADVQQNVEKARELWTIHAKGWWPGGPEDPALRLIRVRVESAEYWDGPSNTSYMLHLLKAVVTHERIADTAGRHGHVEVP